MLIEGPPGTTFALLSNYSFEGGSALLTVYDGPDARSPELFRLDTGQGRIPPGARSTGPSIYVEFSVQTNIVDVSSQDFSLRFMCEQPSLWSPADVAIPVDIDSTWSQPPHRTQTQCFRKKHKLLNVQCCADAEMDCSVARVERLKLRGLNLRGSISPAVGQLTALRELDVADNYIDGDIPREIGRLHQLEHLRLEHNQFGLQEPAAIRSILDGFADLHSLELSTSSETVDLAKTLMVPVPPILCGVGAPCSFTVVTRTSDGDPVTRGGKEIVVQPTDWLGDDHASEVEVSCIDTKDGSYTCELPQSWISHSGVLDFSLAADSEPIVPMRTIENIETGLTRVSEAYPSLSVQIAPIVCSDTRAHPAADGSTCRCEESLIQISNPDDASQLRCDSCVRGKEPTTDLLRCSTCEFGQYSGNGINCAACQVGAAPNLRAAAYQCETCSHTEFSNDGTECKPCLPGQIADDSRTSCICPQGDYNSTLFGSQSIRCVEGDLHPTDSTEEGVCRSCQGLPCIRCPGLSGATLRSGWASIEDHSANVFKCTNKEACEAGGGCAAGYSGTLCESCAEGFGEASGACESCSTDRGSWVGWVLGLTLISGVVAFAYRRHNSRRAEKDGPLADSLTDNPLHSSTTSLSGSRQVDGRADQATLIIRAVYQPVRILVIFGQVVTQVGPVLHMTYPVGIQSLITLLHPIAVDFQAFLQLGCLGYSFYTMWLIKVFAIPLLLVACTAFVHQVKRHRGDRTDAQSAADELKSSLFVVCFLVYPGVCNRSFSLFNCRRFTESMSVLTSDYSVVCQDSQHRAFQFVGLIVIVFFAIGVPVGTLVLMVRRMTEYRSQNSGDRFIARRVADELGVSDESAMDAIRDVSMGRQYSFLLSSFKPRFYYWEAVDMLRKLSIVGLLVMVGEGSLAQLFCGSAISFFFFALHVKLQPYRHDEDNVFRTGTEIFLFFMMTVALVLKGLDNASEETITRGYYDVFLCVLFFGTVPVAFAMAVTRKYKVMEEFMRLPLDQSMTDDLQAKRHALKLLQLGLASNSHRELLTAHFQELDRMFNKMTHVFISYRVASDRELARRLYDALSTTVLPETGQTMRVYLDQIGLEDGQRWDRCASRLLTFVACAHFYLTSPYFLAHIWREMADQRIYGGTGKLVGLHSNCVVRISRPDGNNERG